MTEPLFFQVYKDLQTKKIYARFYLGPKLGVVNVEIPTYAFLSKDLLLEGRDDATNYMRSFIGTGSRPVVHMTMPKSIIRTKHNLDIRPKRKISRRPLIHIYDDLNPKKWISYLFLGLGLGIGAAEVLLKFCQSFHDEPRKHWDSWETIKQMLGIGMIGVGRNFVYSPRVNSLAHPIAMESGDVLFRSVIK